DSCDRKDPGAERRRRGGPIAGHRARHAAAELGAGVVYLWRQAGRIAARPVSDRTAPLSERIELKRAMEMVQVLYNVGLADCRCGTIICCGPPKSVKIA